MTITHDDILERVTSTWLDIIPSRRTIARRSLPSHANEITPNVLVVARKSDVCNLDLCSEFRQRHWKPRFDDGHVPGDFVWQLVTPDGQRLLLFTWVNWKRNSRKMFIDFCQETEREVGTLSLDGSVNIGTTAIPLRSCQIVHEKQFRSAQTIVVKPKSARTILSKAAQLLKCTSSQFKELDCRELQDDEEAHDDQLQDTLKETFLKNCEQYEQAITKKYGAPTGRGSKEHPEIPVNGVIRYFIWSTGKQKLYLAVSHEDRELPWIISMGTVT
ncbi:MAG: hypothetical protein KDA78_03990 [Planctomycetaceae bacterium]|nr:hypothetical protein [Planctomycetaceae bacterium]